MLWRLIYSKKFIMLLLDDENTAFSGVMSTIWAGKMPTPQEFHDYDLYLIKTKSAVLTLV